MYINKFIGPHVSIIGGFDKAIIRAKNVNATACAFFTKNQKSWNSKKISIEDINNFKKNCKLYNFSKKQILPHANFLINLGHPINENLIKSRLAFIQEINRCNKLGLIYINFHPGYHLNLINENKCINRIADSINLSLDKTIKVKLLIENTAGQGSSIGYNFEQIAQIIYKIENKDRIGVCIDTCHLYASGYNFYDKKSYLNIFKIFNEIIGFNYLQALHLNNSKASLGSYIDRHENLHYGKINKIIFKLIMLDNRFNRIPIILETKDSKLWQEEIFWLKNIIKSNKIL